MEILHVSAECYPMAKTGGLGDVVGALPKYQTLGGHIAKVIMPMHRTNFLVENEWVVDYKGEAVMDGRAFQFTIIKEATNKLGFYLYLVEVKGLTDRPKVYGYFDDSERFTAFQIAVVHWVNQWNHKPDVIHCHDHHTGFIPFMMKHCFAYQQNLAMVPSVFTIHNAQYQGWMGWNKKSYIPSYDGWKGGLLEWGKTMNPLASGVKNAWKVTTVSQSYMNELKYHSNGLEMLFEFEKGKCLGILNGIDADVWDPATDKYLFANYTAETIDDGKQKNKEEICKQYGFDPLKPLFVFIGRLVGEKGADLLPDVIKSCMYYMSNKASYFVLGSGDPYIEWQLNGMKVQYPGQYNAHIGYDEALSHKLYAAADFLLMPSRVEPCGLNQMYALRYGTLPVVRSTGGLMDTVKDMGDWEGYGIRFNYANIGDITHAIGRGINVFSNKVHYGWMQRYAMQIDHSWAHTVEEYTNAYQSIMPKPAVIPEVVTPLAPKTPNGSVTKTK